MLSSLRRETRGSVVIETALVAPVLILLALGTFDAGRMVAKQSEIQGVAAQAEAVAQAAVPTDEAARTELEDVLKASLDPSGTDADANVEVKEVYRCAMAEAFVTANTCSADEAVSTFVKITLTDKYIPQWTIFGIGGPVDYNVVRMVQIS